ncbi:MAG: hypothetical protein ACLGI2_01110 [Acidimicrobiia bacterium]
MDRLARRILEAPVATRRATGAVVLGALVAAALAAGVPASAQTSPPQAFAGAGDCVGPGDSRLVDGEGRAVFHGTTWGVHLAPGAGGTVYATDVFMLRYAPPEGAPVHYKGSEQADYIKGVAVRGGQPIWTDTATGAVRLRSATGPEAAVTESTGPPAGGDQTRFLEHGIAVATDGTTYVAVPAANQVYKASASGWTPVSGTALTAPQSLAVVEDDTHGTVLYVAGRDSRVMRIVAGTGVATPVGPTLSPGAYSARLAVDPVGKQLFVADSSGIVQVDLPTEKVSRILAREGDTSGMAIVRSTPQGKPLLVYANWNVPTGQTTTGPTRLPGEPAPTIPVHRCDIQSVATVDPVPPSTRSTEPTTPPTSIHNTVPDTTPTSVPRLEARDAEPQPLPNNNNNNQQAVTDPEQLTGNRAEGSFGQFDPFVANTAALNGQFTPSAGFGGQQLGGFAPSAGATDPFSGGGALSAPGPLETASAGAAGAPAPPASVTGPGPVGAVVPPPAGAPLPAGSPAPVQGWPGAPAEPSQGATRYAMTTDERSGADPLLAGLVGLGGCCLLLAVGAGTRRRDGRAVATAASPARAWAVGR